MKLSNIKKMLGLSIVGTAVVLMTACGSIDPADKTVIEANQVSRPQEMAQVNADNLKVSDIKNTSSEATNKVAEDVSLEKESVPKAVPAETEAETETKDSQVIEKANDDETDAISL